MQENNKIIGESPCVGLRLRKTSRAISQFYDRHLNQAGIRGTQYAMLMHIASNKDITMGELSERLGMDQSTATRGIDILYKMGLVAFAASPEDARKKVLALTSKGTEKIQEANPFWEQAQEKMKKTLKGSNLENLFRLLDQLIEAVK